MEPGTLVLRDIHGLDAIPWWPMAPGWWYLIGAAVLLLLLALRRLLTRLAAAVTAATPTAVAGRAGLAARGAGSLTRSLPSTARLRR